MENVADWVGQREHVKPKQIISDKERNRNRKEKCAVRTKVMISRFCFFSIRILSENKGSRSWKKNDTEKKANNRRNRCLND